MYIMDVIRACDNMFPNNYTLAEKIQWIDELNAKIALEYEKSYGECILTPSDSGVYFLPEGIKWSQVYSIFSGTRELEKKNLTVKSNSCIKSNPGGGTLKFIYLKNAEETRVIDAVEFNGVIFKENGFYLTRPLIQEGDILYIDDGEKALDANVLSVSLKDFNDATFFIETDVIWTPTDENGRDVTITRYITEKTIPSMPYDEMFIHWVCAKINWWQKDYRAYNQCMTQFNQILSDYSHYIFERRENTGQSNWKGWI